MKSRFSIRIVFSFLALFLLVIPAVRFHGQAPPTHANGVSGPDKMDAPETNKAEEQFRKSAAVQAIARTFHLQEETAAEIFEDFNSAVLILAILGFLARALPKAFRKRTETLQKDLADARKASEEANSRLRSVEDRLSRLDSEIEAFRIQMEQESAGDEQRMKETIETERQRIVASAEQDIAAAQTAAQRELKQFAANLAIERAQSELRLTPEADRELVSGFAGEIAGRFGKGARN